ncbi:MAG: bifunctional proline dehydrogenase/L-glutamate gamma-semialdehyde dehydrogenase PutA [Gammaproteobacteria bacterium]
MRDNSYCNPSESGIELHESLKSLMPTLDLACARASRWVQTLRNGQRRHPLMDSLLKDLPVDSPEGRVLMSLAEALLRTPSVASTDHLVAERLAQLRASSSAPSLGNRRLLKSGLSLLAALGRLLPHPAQELSADFQLASMAKPIVGPALRNALRHGIKALANTFIAGESIESALANGTRNGGVTLFSFDMLGEGARTESEAQYYFEAYLHAIDVLQSQPAGDVHRRSGISVKLSALEPRYTALNRERVREQLIPRAVTLARAAARAGIALTLDAEEARRLDLSLDVIEALARDRTTRDWPGLGLAIQAYGARAPLVIDWVARLARDVGRRMTVRLVKGAYWDSEIKIAQESGLRRFQVFTSKEETDANYLRCARRLFAAQDAIYPQFATHNAFTIAAIVEMAPKGARYEFQRLQGMGEMLYDVVRTGLDNPAPVRIYAPVGTHQELLPYLVRRLLENGANSSFVNQLLNPAIPIERVVQNPVVRLKSMRSTGVRDRIREPGKLFLPERINSSGIDWGNPHEVEPLLAQTRAQNTSKPTGGPIIGGWTPLEAVVSVRSPANAQEIIGSTRDATDAELAEAFHLAGQAYPGWNALPAQQRAACLERAADLLEQHRAELLNLLVREAGKTLPDAFLELREAVDFCRYYAARGREMFGSATELRGPTGERNLLSLHGRGVFACISPWNFPLAIFLGQISAALMAGNTVVAKPAPATPLIALATTSLLHRAGVPPQALHLTPADGPAFGRVAFEHRALAGVAFTGSTATAATINLALAGRRGPIVPLIAETGGVNAMIADATALPQQVVDDVITSAFTSAGQRCSALRVLYVQSEAADRIIEMLIGAMKCLVVGEPSDLSTDVGPLISASAVSQMRVHVDRMSREAKLLYACPLTKAHEHGNYFPPHLFELRAFDQIRTEVFGPILHVARYEAHELPRVLDAIRGSGFGLTLGVHSRIESLIDHVFRSVPVGNTYVNRNMVGAVVGVQPFGGQGLSGTGPKAGGPNYLLRFCTERTLTINTTAAGGNAALLAGVGY